MNQALIEISTVGLAHSNPRVSIYFWPSESIHGSS